MMLEYVMKKFKIKSREFAAQRRFNRVPCLTIEKDKHYEPLSQLIKTLRIRHEFDGKADESVWRERVARHLCRPV